MLGRISWLLWMPSLTVMGVHCTFASQYRLSFCITVLNEYLVASVVLRCWWCLISVAIRADSKGLQMTAHVESLREKVYVTLEEYCRRQYPDDPGRFAKLLLRLPALRSIGLKCPSYLFLSQLCQAEGSSPETYISLLLKGIYAS